MNKISGKREDFAYIREDGSRIVIGYGLTAAGGDMYEWYEVYLPTKSLSQVTMETVMDAIIGDINARTDSRILDGFRWNGIGVWLSAENQRNFSEAQRMASAMPAILPLTFKLGEDEDGSPVYHTFETSEELNAFYMGAFSYINQCLNAGWQEKDSIDWTEYEALFPSETVESVEDTEGNGV